MPQDRAGEAAGKGDELGGKAAGARQPQRGQAGNAEDHHDDRHLAGQAAQVVQVTGVGLVIDQSNHGKQQAGDNAVAEHLEAGACQAYLVQGKDAQQHISHVADAAVGNQPFQVGLPQRDRGAVDNADNRQDRM